MNDKVKMKDIVIEERYIGWDHSPSAQTMVKTDQKRFQQILLNLYTNAIKFTDRQGKIVIIVEKVSKANCADHLIVYVMDSGMGIKMND